MSQSYWLDCHYTPRAPLSGKHTADIAIIGGGMTGVGLAYYGRQRGASIAVVERGCIAEGATGRNLGLIISGLGEHYAGSIRFWGRGKAGFLTNLHLQNHALVAAVVAENAIECDYRRSGSYSIAADVTEASELYVSHLLLAEDGFDNEFLDANQVNRALESEGFCAAVFNPADGHVDPVRLVRGMAGVVEGSGVRFFENSPVSDIRQGGASWVIRTRRGELSAPQLFIATNAWLPRLPQELPIRAVRGQCCTFGPLARPRPESSCFCRYGSEYWRSTGNYTLVGGMRRVDVPSEVGLEDTLNPTIQGSLESFFRERFPMLRTTPVSHRWSGPMAYTPDGLPLIGELESGCFFAGGYTGHGFGYAFLAAQWLIALALEKINRIPELLRIGRTLRVSPALEEI